MLVYTKIRKLTKHKHVVQGYKQQMWPNLKCFKVIYLPVYSEGGNGTTFAPVTN